MSFELPERENAPSAASRPLTRREALAAERAQRPAETSTESPHSAALEPAAPAESSEPVMPAAAEPASLPAPVATELPSRRALRAAASQPAKPSLGEPLRRAASSVRAASRPAWRPSSSPAARPVVSKRPVSTRRRVGTSLLSVVAMGFVAAVTIATSVPADALLSSAEVQARALKQLQQAALIDGQSISADGSVSLALPADSYSAQSKADYAAASGIQIANTFTNNPNGSVQWPFAVGVVIGDRFGSTYGRSSAHRGLDFNPGSGAPIQAIADGTVVLAEEGEGSLGVNLAISHTINGQTVTSVYAHLQYGSMRFKVGDTVKVGQVVGNVGNTGYSTGPHLHFEIRLGGINGEQIDPLPWLYANTN